MSGKQITLYSAEVCSSRMLSGALILNPVQESPFSHRVALALEEANLPYDNIVLELINKPDWYKEKVYPGAAKVPILLPPCHAPTLAHLCPYAFC